jgi:hypothetical protein
MAENRIAREQETREQDVRKRSWELPNVLPTPRPEPGYEFHWVRISIRGEADPRNISLKLQEGWEPVKASDHPEIFVAGVENAYFKDNIVIGGLMLCKTPTDFVEDRNKFFNTQAADQMRTVDNNLMRENDPRMPLFNERKTKVTFGRGS